MSGLDWVVDDVGDRLYYSSPNVDAGMVPPLQELSTHRVPVP